MYIRGSQFPLNKLRGIGEFMFKFKIKLSDLINLVFLTMIFGGIVFGAVRVADNYIIDTNNDLEINASKINQVLYVQSGNASDIQVQLDANPSITGGGTVVIPAGNYPLMGQQNLTSNLTLIIEQGASIYWSTGEPQINYTDKQGNNYSAMFYGNNLDDVKILNYGILEPRKQNNPSSQETCIMINNSENIEVKLGRIKSTHEGIAIFNSNYTFVYNIKSDTITSTPVWFECVNHGEITDIRGSGEECVDLNAYCTNIYIGDIEWTQRNNTGNEVIDINDAVGILISGVYATNASHAVTLSQSSGVRFGTCPVINSENISAVNIHCNGCQEESVVNCKNCYVDEFVNGQKRIKNWGRGIKFSQDNITNSGDVAFWFMSDANQTNQELMQIHMNGDGSDEEALKVINDGTGDGILIDQNGDGICLNLDGGATSKNTLKVVSSANSTNAIFFYSNIVRTPTSRLFYIQDDNSGNNEMTVEIDNDGNGKALFINQDGTEGIGIDIDSESSAPSIRIQTNSTPVICNITYEGGIYYNTGKKQFFGCNSTNWLNMTICNGC